MRTAEVTGGEERSLTSGPTAPSPPVHRFVRRFSVSCNGLGTLNSIQVGVEELLAPASELVIVA